jgi:hypothetical protein
MLTIVEEHAFVIELDALQAQYPRIYEVKDAISWQLAKNPQAGKSLANDPKCKVLTYQFGTTTFLMFYRFNSKTDRDHVHLLSIIPAPSPFAERRREN